MEEARLGLGAVVQRREVDAQALVGDAKRPGGGAAGLGAEAWQQAVDRDEVEDGQALQAVDGDAALATLDGEDLTIQVEPGTQPGTVKRFRKRGIPSGDGWGRRGDLLVELKVDIPTGMSDEERRLLRQLAELRGENSESPAANGLFARLRGSTR